MSRRLLLVPALAAALLSLPASAAAADSPAGAGPSPAASGSVAQAGASAELIPSTVKIRLGHLRKGSVKIFRSVRVIGSLTPFRHHQKVKVTFFRNAHKLRAKTVKVHRGKGDYGVFYAKLIVRKGGKYAASASFAPTPEISGDTTVRKSWTVSFPSLHRGECGRVVRGFRKGLNRLGYEPAHGRCFNGKMARGVLALRKVRGMSRNSHAGRRLVQMVYSGRGGYRVRHPGAGRHVEAPLAKQVIVFAKGDEVEAIYPISSGKPSTPTVRGHFHFYSTQPGYNAEGMYYSFYFIGGYAIHGYHSVPNYPASHGCLRTYISDQPEIFHRISYGEDIFVF
jgi:hypothetical protein